mmetsp:Transcript_15828/g.34682  ORF Transcript_15828/g.34682 Transcript_15828/m.34682 type:complete len:341 (+) Transcript_15828:67-1089(+)
MTQRSSTVGLVEVANGNRILKAKIPIERRTTNNHNNENTEKKIKTVELIGRSWAADSTAFVIADLDLALDAGYPVHGGRCSSVLITHAHTDHIHHLTHLKSRSKPPNFFLPMESVDNVQKFIDVAQQMTSQLTPEEYETIDWDPCFRLNGASPGERLVIHKKRGIIARTVKCDHSIACLGYCIYEEKSRLKPEYKSLPGREIGKLRKSGVQVIKMEEHALLCFLGDTHASILDGPDAEQIFSCPTVIIECSFLTDDCKENAARTKHVCWSELKPHVLSHPQTMFVLTHFSHRWSTAEIIEFFQRENIPNVLPWVPADPNLYCRPVGGAEAEAIDEVWSHF